MTFDTTDLVSSLPLLFLTVAGIVLLMLDAFSRVVLVGREHHLKMPAETSEAVAVPPPGSREITGAANAAYSVFGRPVSAVPWAQSPLNRLAPAELPMSPGHLLAHYLGRDAGLKELDDWLKPGAAWLDQL